MCARPRNIGRRFLDTRALIVGPVHIVTCLCRHRNPSFDCGAQNDLANSPCLGVFGTADTLADDRAGFACLKSLVVPARRSRAAGPFAADPACPGGAALDAADSASSLQVELQAVCRRHGRDICP